MSYHVRKNCRLCSALDLETVLQLEDTPLANEFNADREETQEKFPLYLARCRSCGHVQLPVVVDPARLFRNYVYVSGTSPSFVEHFRRYAQEMISGLGLQAGDLVVDVGSNDGTLLRFFKEAGMRVIGIDPAMEIAARATASGIETIPEFFNRELSAKIAREHGPARLVVANNVFAHADNLAEISTAAQILLDPDRGRFVFEVQYVVDLIEKTLCDVIYHEHLSYHSVEPLVSFFDILSMKLEDVSHVDTHGGSIRCVVSPWGSIASDRVDDFIKVERATMLNDPWIRLKDRIDASGEKLRGFLHGAARDGLKVAGFGAPAKLTTLCHQFGIVREDISYIVDDNPLKQGLFSPSIKIPIVPSSRLREEPPDRVVIFAWNFADQIAAKHPELAGRFVVPLPTYREI